MKINLNFNIGLLIFFESVNSINFTAIRDAAWPYDIATPFCYRTPSPINIDTDKVRYLTTLPPLRWTIGLFESFFVTNTGRSGPSWFGTMKTFQFFFSVLITANKNVLTSVTGGLLGNDVYVFQEATFYWSPNFRSSAANDIDGIGAPLFFRVVLRNRKYPNAATAIKYRDGFVVAQINVQVEGYVPNPSFEIFGRTLRCIKRAGSTVPRLALPIFIWLDQLALKFYYAYPGSIIETCGSSVQYDSATIVQFPKSGSGYISIPQFQDFVNLLDATGNPIVNRISVFPDGGRPVIEVSGSLQSFFPTAA